VDKLTNKQMPLETSTALRYASSKVKVKGQGHQGQNEKLLSHPH